jgi:Mg-chelatase subunit ChlD
MKGFAGMQLTEFSMRLVRAALLENNHRGWKMKNRKSPVRHNGCFMCVTALVLFLSIPAAMSVGESAADFQGGLPDKTLKVDLLFVLDNSGSMIQNDPQFITRTVVTKYLKNLKESFRVGMVVFDRDARLVEPLMAVTTPADTERLLKGLSTINYKGQFTNTPVAIERAIYELKTHGREDAQKVIVLLTDGIVDTGNKNEDLEAEKWLRENLAAESKKAGIRIFGVAFTDKADFRLIQSLAIQTDGEYFRAYTTNDIQKVFNKIELMLVEPIETLEKSVPAPLPEAAPGIPRKTSPVEPPGVPAEPEPAVENAMPIPLLLAGIVIIVIIFSYLVYMHRRKDVIIKADSAKNVHMTHEADEFPMTPAELIDADNIITNTSVSLSLPLDKKVIRIGRDLSNDVVIPNQSVSSFHATIEYKTGYYYLEDHRSTNGTKLNKKLIRENTSMRLKSGDIIHFADCEFRFLVPDAAPCGETVMIKRDALN